MSDAVTDLCKRKNLQTEDCIEIYGFRDCRNPGPLATILKVAKQANRANPLKHLQECIPCRQCTLERERALAEGVSSSEEELDALLTETIMYIDQQQKKGAL
jgi:hypothetical protein